MSDETAPGLRQLQSPPHRNHGLFSDHYLNETLAEYAPWRLYGQTEEVADALACIRQIFDAYVPSPNEAQTEDELIKPVLRVLGHTVEVQASLAVPGSARKPDYIFYRDHDALVANKGKLLTEELLADTAFAVGDAKHWDRPLDVTLKGRDPFSNQNPTAQIEFYMRYSGVAWGILTNGRLWRLYHRDSVRRLDRYYEVDLPALLEEDDPARFLYFYGFFGRRAFDHWELGVETIRVESIAYATGISESLKLQVFDALRHLAQGFLDRPANRLGTGDADLKAIYDASLIVLYRLLFILYAEARDLLPIRANEAYRDTYSLSAIIRDLRLGRPLLRHTSIIWARVLTLFQIIDEGEPELGVPIYNGGLFDPERHPFLVRHAVGDHHLRKAIEMLAAVKNQLVDYRDLSVRHLGTIYEGLLEFHLEGIAPADGWTVDLRNDKGERKATGSYYTPDFIVSYMVEQTLAPILQGAVASARDDAARVEAVLSINVLDMAMGSGHFLVEATEFIARFLVGLGVPAPGAHGEDDLSYWRRRVAAACIYGLDLNPLAVELAMLSLWLITVSRDRPLSFLDHHLRAGNALIGTRLSALTAADPLVGASSRGKATEPPQLALIDEESLRRSLSTAVSSMWLIETSDAATVEAVKEQERLYADLHRQLVGAYGMLADVLTARHFGVDLDAGRIKMLLDHARGEALAAPAPVQEWLQEARDLAARHRFFHWELEFPEVFFDRHGRHLGEAAGFHAVVGNPPYIRQEALGAGKPYLAAAFPQVYHGMADLYVYFYQQGLQLTRPGGRMSYIVTNKWMRSGYGEPLRGYFATEAIVERIIDFGHAPIFPEADVFPCILVLERPGPARPATERQVQVTAFPRTSLHRTSLARYVGEHSHRVPHSRLGSAAWSLEPQAVEDLLAKVVGAGVPLAQYAGVKPYRGILTGLNEAFLIDTRTRDRLVREDPACAPLLRPYLRGQDIKRWAPDWEGLWMIVIPSSGDKQWPWSNAVDAEEALRLFAATYPAIHAHFLPLAERLRQRQDKGRFWWELRACAYYDLFDRPKVMYQEIQFHPAYSFDTAATLANNKVFILPREDPYLLAVLNSPLMWWHNWRYLPHMKDEALSPTEALLRKLPVAPPSDAILAEAEPAVARLIELTRADQQARRDTLEWLRVEFAVESPGQRLEDFAGLDADAFVAEVRASRSRTAPRLSAAALRALREGYSEQAAPLHERRAEIVRLERRLSSLVNDAYGLTAAEVELLWETAPPRMPDAARPPTVGQQ